MKYVKESDLIGNGGCLGYPAAILLFSIADSVGAYVYNTTIVSKHYKILNDTNYYNLKMSPLEEKRLKDNRDALTHNTALTNNFVITHYPPYDYILKTVNNVTYLNLATWAERTNAVLKKVWPNLTVLVQNSVVLKDLLKKT